MWSEIFLIENGNKYPETRFTVAPSGSYRHVHGAEDLLERTDLYFGTSPAGDSDWVRFDDLDAGTFGAFVQKE